LDFKEAKRRERSQSELEADLEAIEELEQKIAEVDDFPEEGDLDDEQKERMIDIAIDDYNDNNEEDDPSWEDDEEEEEEEEEEPEYTDDDRSPIDFNSYPILYPANILPPPLPVEPYDDENDENNSFFQFIEKHGNPNPNYPVDTLLFIGAYFRDRLEQQGIEQLQDLIDFVRGAANQSVVSDMLNDVFTNERPNMCIGPRNRRNQRRNGFQYKTNEVNKMAFNSVVLYLRKRLERQHQWYLVNENEDDIEGDDENAVWFNRIPNYIPALSRLEDDAYPDECA